MNKKPTFFYRVCKVILGPVFKFYYRPTVIGKENIPEEGPVLIVGDHIHLFDQCLAIIATKRGQHWMAKKEYFDDKKVAWFFKATGCISVDRSKKDSSATDKALSVLKDGGMIGLFPEGTRNATKEENAKRLYDKAKSKEDFEEFFKRIHPQKYSQLLYVENLLDHKKITIKEFNKALENVDKYLKDKLTEDEYFKTILLDFKFGAVSMAQKTNATIVPFGISGDYKYKSDNLTIRFGKPFKVGDMPLDKANTKLYNIINNLIRENYKK